MCCCSDDDDDVIIVDSTDDLGDFADVSDSISDTDEDSSSDEE